MSESPFGFLRVKGVALATTDLARACAFYGDTLALPEVRIAGELVGYQIGETVIMPKADWYGTPTTEPNYRVTLEVENARATEAALRAKGITIADPVKQSGEHSHGSFLDSEGNKLWFCS
jgi:catechol 2,3-dioxygenase-like lactoylglutathione lyase family enzyme